MLPAAIDLEIRIAYVPTADRRVELTRLDDGERDAFDLDDAPPRRGRWLDYVVGTAWALAEAGLPLTGLRGVIASTLPPNAGLSSSAAIELASAWAMLHASAPSVDPFALALICQRAENGFVGVQSGLMDQFAESCGVAGSALLLDCRSHDWRPIPLPGDLVLVVCHTGSPRHLDGSAYNLRRSQCEAAVAELARTDPAIRSLRDVTLEALVAARDRLDPVAFRRAEHVVTENARVEATVAALAAGDLAAVGRLFAESHASLRDRFEVSSPELDAMVEIASSVAGRRRRPDDRCRVRRLHGQPRSPGRGGRAARRRHDRVPGPNGPDAAGPPGHGRGWGGPADLIDASATSAAARPSSPGLHDICDVRAHAPPPRFARVRHA